MIELGYLAGLDNPQWRDDAVAAVLDSLYLRYPDLTQQFGPGRRDPLARTSITTSITWQVRLGQ